jgi:hypothetical protein
MRINRKPRPILKADDLFDSAFPILFGAAFCTIVLVFVSIPVTGYFRVTGLQKALNAECGTSYSLVEVALNGDNLLELCRVKQQQVTIK